MNKALIAGVTLLALAGCNKESAPTKPAPPSVNATLVSASAPLTDLWIGGWTGVEGLHLSIAKDPAAGPGHYLLTMQYGLDADDAGTFKGVAVKKGIAFTRPDGDKVLQAGTGEDTGLKWLAEERNCLVVTSGEGYCRKP